MATHQDATAVEADKLDDKPVASVEDSAVPTDQEAPAGDEATPIEYAYPVTIRLPAPTNSTALIPVLTPEGKKAPPPSSLTVQISSADIVQELRLQVQDSPAGYWLGPFSFRLPVGEGETKGQLVNKGRDNLEVRLGDKLSDFYELGEVFGGEGREDKERVLEVHPEPYSETDARHQVLRLREYLSTGSDAQDPSAIGVSSGSSLYEQVRDGLVLSSEHTETSTDVALSNGASKANKSKKTAKPAPRANTSTRSDSLVASNKNSFEDFDSSVPTSLVALQPRPAENLTPAVCLKSIAVSPWNPPPPQWRSKGHLLYLTLTTLEGETLQLTSTVRGWFVSKSTSVSFDPSPRPAPKAVQAHALIDLLHGLSPAFTAAFLSLVAREPSPNGPQPREILATAAIPQSLPANPWIVSPTASQTVPEPLRQQLAFLYSGAVTADGLEGARDWNDEIQQAREMPRETMQDRVNREKIIARTQAEFTAACVRSAMVISRGDILPLNPHEPPSAHMWLYRNIFFTKGVDTVDTFSHLGGDDAAHAASGKDVGSIRALNRLDVGGLSLLGHTVVDWAGERWVCQTFLPGIFRRKEDEVKKEGLPTAATVEGEVQEDKADTIDEAHLIVYGSDFEAGPNVIRWNPTFHSLMGKVADGFRLAEHSVKTSDLSDETVKVWSSTDVKGLLGTDGRKYLLDAFRLCPVDVEWLQKDLEGQLYSADDVHSRTDDMKAAGSDKAYPHRLVLLRSELLESHWDSEFRKWATELAGKTKEKRKKDVEAAAPSVNAEASSSTFEPVAAAASDSEDKKEGDEEKEDPAAPVVPEKEEQVVVQANGEVHVHQLDGTVDVTKSGSAFFLRYNADAWVDGKPVPPKGQDPTVAVPGRIDSIVTDESDASIKAVRDASVFLREAVIPSFVVEVLNGKDLPLDGLSLTKALHTRGINMRYLGILAANLDRVIGATSDVEAVCNLKTLLIIVLQEMVFRVCKRLLRAHLKSTLSDQWPAATSHFLNCLLGSSAAGSPKPSFTPSLFLDDASPPWVSLSPDSLRTTIAREVEIRFRYTLPASYIEKNLKKRQMLREIASRVGLQLAARDYVFEHQAEVAEGEDAQKKRKGARRVKGEKERSSTFEPEDVVALVPIVKDAEPSSAASEETMETGKIMLNRGDRAAGLEIMQEAISLFETIHAMFHRDLARAYNSYSVAVHSLFRQKAADPEAKPTDLKDELAQALRYQRQCIIVAERTIGADHPDTLQYYLTLAMLEHLSDNVDMTLKLFRHTLELWDVIYGPDHPDQITILSNVGHVLSVSHKFSASTRVWTSMAAASARVYGEDSVQVANAHHSLSQSIFCDGDLAGARAHSEKAAALFLAKLGAEDPATLEATQLANAFKSAEAQGAVVQPNGGGMRFPAAVQQQQQAAARRAAAAARPPPAAIEQQQQQQSGAGVRKLSSADYAARSRATAGLRPLPTQSTPSKAEQEQQAKVDPNGIASRGHLEVEDLVKYVTGSKISKKAKKL